MIQPFGHRVAEIPLPDAAPAGAPGGPAAEGGPRR